VPRVFTSARFRALGFRFDVAGPWRDPIARCDELFSGLAVASRARVHHYELRTTRRRGSERYELRLDGERIGARDDVEPLVLDLAVDANRRAVASSRVLTLHAGGVEHDGRGLVLPGVSEAGKSTLVAGLVSRGFRYLSDEAVGIDWRSLALVPYPKPLGLDRGSWDLFPELAGRPAARGPEQWLVAVARESLGGRCPAAAIVFPRYEAGARTTLEPLRRAEALIELTKNTFRFDALGRRALQTLGELVAGVECFRLSIGDLDAACTVVGDLTDGLASRGAA
jgi:hypothetical protein